MSQRALHVPPGLLHANHLLVAQRHVLGRERVIVAVHEELAVIALGRLDRLSIQLQALLAQLEVSPPAAGAAQRSHAFALHVLGRIAHGGQLGFKVIEQVTPVRLLTRGLLGVEAQHVAQAPLTVSDHDLLDLQPVVDLAVASRTLEHLLGGRITPAQWHAHQVLAPARGQRLEVGCRDHAGIAHEQAARELPVAQIALDLGDRAHVHRIAWKHPVAHRKTLARDGHAHHDLRRVGAPALGQPALAWCAIGLAPCGQAAVHGVFGSNTFILLIDLEVQRGGVVEQHFHIQVQQVGYAQEDLALDRLLVGLQKVHGAVQVLQRQALGARDVHFLLEPLLPAVQLGARSAGAVGHHREQRALHIKAQAARLRLGADHLVNAQTLPQRLQHVDLTVGPGTDQAHVALAGALDLLGRAAAQDAGGELAQALGHRRVIGASAVVEHASLRAAPLGRPDVLGQLQIRHGAAVGTSLLGLAQVHVPKRRRLCAGKSRGLRRLVYLGVWRASVVPAVVKSTVYVDSTRQNRAHVP